LKKLNKVVISTTTITLSFSRQSSPFLLRHILSPLPRRSHRQQGLHFRSSRFIQTQTPSFSFCYLLRLIWLSVRHHIHSTLLNFDQPPITITSGVQALPYTVSHETKHSDHQTTIIDHHHNQQAIRRSSPFLFLPNRILLTLASSIQGPETTLLSIDIDSVVFHHSTYTSTTPSSSSQRISSGFLEFSKSCRFPHSHSFWILVCSFTRSYNLHSLVHFGWPFASHHHYTTTIE
jgi:hypothetical protein